MLIAAYCDIELAVSPGSSKANTCDAAAEVDDVAEEVELEVDEMDELDEADDVEELDEADAFAEPADVVASDPPPQPANIDSSQVIVAKQAVFAAGISTDFP